MVYGVDICVGGEPGAFLMRLFSRRERAEQQETLLIPLDMPIERAGGFVRTLLLSLIAVIFGLLAIGATAPMRELAMAPGVVKPGGQVIELRHVDGGEVEEILVRRGDPVARGDVLLRLRPLRVEAELRQLQVRRAHLKLRADRLTALAQGATPRFSEDPVLEPEAIAAERALYQLEASALAAEIAAKRSRIEQTALDAATRRTEAADLSVELDAYDQQVAMQAELVSRGASPRRALLELAARQAEAKARHGAALGAARSAETAIAGIESEIAQLRAARISAWSREYAEIGATIAELDGEILRRLDRVERLEVRAPVDGLVQELGAQTAGGVIAPGGLSAMIVPLSDAVSASIRISPDDIGHVHVGDEATVRVTTFDVESFGEINGEITLIAPTSSETEKGERYFHAELALDHVESLQGGEVLRLTPGMVVEARIQTGSKSVLRYLFKPVARALDKAFAER